MDYKKLTEKCNNTINISTMHHSIDSGEFSIPLKRPGKIAAAATAMALVLGACNGENGQEPRVFRDVNTVAAEPAPMVSELAYYHQLDLLGTVWRAPEKVSIGGREINVYREFDSLKTSGTLLELAKAVQNSLLLEEILSGGAQGDGFAVRSSKQVKHQFFIFESRESLAEADSEGLYGPLTTSLVNLQGITVENVTLLAPFRRSAFLFSSSLDGSLYKQQLAVSGNMLDITLGQSVKGAILNSEMDAGSTQSKEIADKAMEIKRALSENLALAVTVKSGKEHIKHLGGDYEYYAVITKALQNEADELGAAIPRLLLTPEQYDKIVV